METEGRHHKNQLLETILCHFVLHSCGKILT
jgi:hypothetical protein